MQGTNQNELTVQGALSLVGALIKAHGVVDASIIHQHIHTTPAQLQRFLKETYT